MEYREELFKTRLLFTDLFHFVLENGVRVRKQDMLSV